MRWEAWLFDYDGTLASEGKVAQSTLQAVLRLKATGARLLLVSGREKEELFEVFPEAKAFDLLVLENGPLLFSPSTREERLLGPPPPPPFVRELITRRVAPLSIGRCVVATTRSHDSVVSEAIARGGYRLDRIYNHQSLMVLPRGMSKATGARAALQALGIEPARAVAVGDAENDLELLGCCGLRIAVSNAIPELKRIAHRVTRGAAGEGVSEAIDGYLRSGFTPDESGARERTDRH